eukprot:TRINITY_DN67338_c0_g1_i1.p1 TRINITY_DN67338_c0_g1~~TRINITY_DN67338_c0_g1_i1.p1  ORF type:complete len:414 (-),score=51.90 TRINITY_DN67338_c0_g1_i1:164-1405(-)
MYSIFLPFGAVVVDLCNVFVYFKYDFWLLGGATALFALFPLFVASFLLYSRWTRLKQATIFIGFLQSGTQLLFQTTLLIRFWDEFNGVLIEYGTLRSPQYTIILVSCVFASFVVAKSARECHFLSQDPHKDLHVRLSHFRATPFFLLHTSYRAISLGLVCAFLPVWAWCIIIAVLLSTNFIIAYKIFDHSGLFSLMTSFTAILTPSLYPTDHAVHISLLGRFHILNSVATTAVIVIAAFTTNSVTQDNLVWTPTTGLRNASASDTVVANTSYTIVNETLSDHLQLNASSNPLNCPPVPSTTPILLTYGVLPPILVASLAYILIVVVIMGLVRPAFLELPVSHQSSRQESTSKSPIIEKRDKCSVIEETEEHAQTTKDNQESEEQVSLLIDKRKSNILFEAEFRDFVESNETQL